MNAFKEILDGEANEVDLALPDDDWTIEERCHEVLNYWKLDGLDLTQTLETLSGGQKPKY